MCRRFTQACPWDAVQAALGLAGESPELAPRYNLAPTQDALLVRLEYGRRVPALILVSKAGPIGAHQPKPFKQCERRSRGPDQDWTKTGPGEPDFLG